MTMQTYQIGDAAGLTSLARETRAIPEPGPGQALIRLRAAALNHRDLMIVSGTYGAAKPPTRIPLGDGVGEIVALGTEVTNIAVGDRVSLVHFTPWLDGPFDPAVFRTDLGSTLDGWLSDYVVMPAPALIEVPDTFDDIAAASMPAVGVTAWAALHSFAQVKPGDKVLVLGTGGVSIMALQLAKIAGAQVVALSSSDAKLDAVKQFGADITINYRTAPEWDRAVQKATGGGVDIVIETVGNATLGKSLGSAAPNARIALIGALGGKAAPDLNGLIGKTATLKGIASGSRKMLADVYAAFIGAGVQPVVDKVFAFADAPDAYAYLAKGEHLGKVVITGS